MKNLIICFFPFLLVFGPGSSHTALGQTPEDKYKVVINHEEQYSVWPSDRKAPRGWKDTGVSGTQKKCQRYIEEVWTDMRPLSIRNRKRSGKGGYTVVINHEEQYLIWPAALDPPKGWKPTGIKGGLAECTDHIKEVWTDMRPLSVRKGLKPRNK